MVWQTWHLRGTLLMKNYRVRVETNDGCVTIWHEKSKAKSAHLLINNRVYNQLCGLNIKEVSVTLSVWIMNYTLKELQQRVNQMIEQQGEDAHCAAWIYTKNDCHLKDEDGEIDYNNNVEDPEVVERIFDDVGNIDYIYQVIQECVDEVTEEQVMLQQPELI